MNTILKIEWPALNVPLSDRSIFYDQNWQPERKYWHGYSGIVVPEPYQAGPRQDGSYAIYPYDEQFLPTDRFIGDPGFRTKQHVFARGVQTW